MKAGSRLLFLTATLVVASLCCISAFAQDLATLSGRVTDPKGLPVPGVSVQAINVNTNVVYPSQTNGVGLYNISTLPPGTYRVIVQKDGFVQIVKPGVELHVSDIIAVNFALEIGSVTQSVTVEAGAPLVNTQSAAVSTVIDRNFAESLPLNGRSFNTLLQLTPGVVIAPAIGGSPGQFSISGQRTSANTFSVDGVSANFGSGLLADSQGNGTGASQALSAVGGTSSLVSVEALQEFRVETSSFAPEFGHTPGGQVILTTRSGTDSFHGGIYEYFRNDVMDANDWFNATAIPRIPKSPERHNDFGGYLGGPILQGNTFFFLSYEGARLRLPETELIQVPSEFARTSAPADLAPYLNAFPLPGDRTITPGVYTSPFIGSFSNSATLNATSIRLDHRIDGRFSIFGRYNYAPSQIVQRFNALSSFSPATANTQTITLGLDMLLTNGLSNSLRGNYSTQESKLTNGLDSFGGAVPLNPSFFLGSLASANDLGGFITFDTTFYSIGLSGRNKTAQADIVDGVTVVRGNHELKFGGEYRAIYFHAQSSNNEVVFESPSVESFITNGTVLFLLGQTAHPARLRSQSTSIYGQDTWKLNSRLALTYGLRWELNPAPSALGSTTLASWTNTNNPAALALAPNGTPLWKTSYASFAPRIGLAYQLTQNGGFVIRAGWGLFYDQGAASAGALVRDFPNIVSQLSFNMAVPFTDPSTFLPVITLQPPFPASAAGYSNNLEVPRSYQWNVGLEKTLAGNQAISATYVGQIGRDLLRNEALFQPNANFLGDFLLTANDARSMYNALQLQYRRPLSRRLQALLSYTWSHSLDNASDDVVAGLSNTVISAANDYASSGFDVRHSFSGALSYSVPTIGKSRAVTLVTRNWSIDTVVVARTGFPFNAVLQSVSPDPGGSALSRPDRVPGQPLWLYGSQCASVFQGLTVLGAGQSCPDGKGLNPAAFSIPSTTRQGTERRNDIPGFGLTQIDLSIGRKFPISEKVALQFRADAFNVINHPSFTNPSANLDNGPSTLLSQQMLNQGLGGLNSLFQEGGPRSLQLSLKLSF